MKINNQILLVVIIIIALAFVSESLNRLNDNENILISEPWDHSPITVYIDDENVPEHYSPSYRTDVEKALDYWERAGNGQLTYEAVFEIVEGESDDIVIIWVDNLEKDAGVKEGVAGYTRLSIVNGKYEYAYIALETGNYQGYSWSQYGDTDMQDIATHELGHALGLGHTNDRDDIMYPTYDRKENVNPLLLQSTWPLLLILIVVAVTIISYHGTGWLRFRKKRKDLEDEIFSGDENE